ncbi:MAG: hypothetical protein PHH77_10165 [Victivallaceae bacterium]|nr:hypothetical protein [Victivallaceae bacterium]
MKYSAALDLSGKFAAFAVAETLSGKLLLTEHKAMHGRSSAALSGWIAELLHRRGLAPAEISRWTVGGGPGSFTGMRLAAALVIGLTLGRDGVESRCVPTAVVLGDPAGLAEGDKAAAVFDGRNQEILLFELVKSAGELVPSGRTEVLDRERAQTVFAAADYRQLAAFDYDRHRLEAVLPPAAAARIRWVKYPAAEKLISCAYRVFDQDLTALAYIRPAVFTQEAVAK